MPATILTNPTSNDRKLSSFGHPKQKTPPGFGRVLWPQKGHTEIKKTETLKSHPSESNRQPAHYE
jgi:hypothetical protein